ncbi:imidazole glycerol phosphate synthase subunit HisH [Myxococcota bacterium]|nr:imidazole glycerol phosphate synthase subunit HisH [Myxococcota bacterium]
MTRARVALVDYGAGNLRSVAKALERSGLEVELASEPAVIERADGVVLPGAGAFADGMAGLRRNGLDEALLKALEVGRPYLGLCLGVQLLFELGEEHGLTEGLGAVKGRVQRFTDLDSEGERRRVPHIGWNEVQFSGAHPMLEHLPERDFYYFVHSNRPVPADERIVVGRTHYGDEFASAIAQGSIFAVQFHPEKSQHAGLRLLNAYTSWVESSR